MTIHLSDVAGVYGAVVATAMAVFRFIDFRRDRQSVRLTWRIAGHPSGRADESPWVIIKVTNVGRRTVHLRDLGVVNTKSEKAAVGSDIGVNPQLDEGQEVGVTPRPEALLAKGVRTVFVEDTHGREWAMPKRAFRELRDAYRAAVEASLAARLERQEASLKEQAAEARKQLGDMLRRAQKATDEESS